MSPTRVLQGLVFGLIGGALGWFLTDVIWRLVFFGPLVPDAQTMDAWREYVLATIVGLAIGAGLGVAEGIRGGTQQKFVRAIINLTGFGAFAGLTGITAGRIVYGAFGGNPYLQGPNPAELLHQVIARAVGWGVMGLVIGLVLALPSLSPQRMRNGAVGGALGGLVAGLTFQLFASTGAFSGVHLRLIGWVAVGGAIGFFVSLVDEALKQAWVRVLMGRNEGREHVIERSPATIGRDELADVPIFGDLNVAKQHASIVRDGGGYVLRDEGTPGGTYLNGQPMAGTQPLRDGDVIQVGGVQVAFHEKVSGAPASRPRDVARSPVVMPSAMPGVCAYCGQQQDPMTGACACAVGAPVGAPAGGGMNAPMPAMATGPAPVPPGGACPYCGQPPEPLTGMCACMPAGGGEAYPAAAPGMGYAPPMAAPGVGARLVGIGGPHTGQVFPLAAGPLGIGREAAREIALVQDPTASRRHATVYASPAGYVLRDEGSANGTFVNGARIMEQPLRPGDQIRIGSTDFRFEI